MADNKLLPEGEQRGRVVHVVRTGKHAPRMDKYNKGPQPRLWLTYELLDEKNDQGKNRWVSFVPYGEPINSFFTERGKQADWLASIGFRSNNEESLQASVGTPVWLDFVHNTNPKTGITYANIDEVSKVRPRDAEDFPELMNTPVYFDFYKPVKEDYIALPKWIKDYLKSSEDCEATGNDKTFAEWDKIAAEEYAASKDTAEDKPKPAPEPKKDPNPDEYDDDVPF